MVSDGLIGEGGGCDRQCWGEKNEPEDANATTTPNDNSNNGEITLADHDYDIYDIQTAYLNTNWRYAELEGKSRVEYLYVLFNLNEFFLSESNSYATTWGQFWRSGPDVSSTASYYRVAEGIKTTDLHGIILNRVTIYNGISETMNVAVEINLYYSSVAVNSYRGSLTIPAHSNKNIFETPVFIPDTYESPTSTQFNVTKISINLFPISNSYHGELEHILVP